MEGEGGAAGVPKRPDLGLLHRHFEVEEGAPVEVALNKGDEGCPFLRGEAQVVGVADGGHPVHFHNWDHQALRGRPAVKGLHQDIEEIWARRTALGKAVLCLPLLPVHLPEAEALAESSVEGTEAADDVMGGGPA